MNPEINTEIFELLLWFLPVGIFCWWLGFIATKRLRMEKNKQREERARKALARRAQEQGSSTPKQDNSNA